jgi:amino acid transporter
MSCDYAVWHTQARMSNAQAGRLYHALCAGDTSGVFPSPAIAAFYEEITALHPEIDDVPQDQLDHHELCPWSVAIDRSDGHLIMCSVWPRADYVGGLVRKLARKHGLAMYDPQAEQILYPNDATPSLLKRLWWNLREDPAESRDPWYVDIAIGILFLAVTWFSYFGRADFARGEGHVLLRWMYELEGSWLSVALPAVISLWCLFFGMRKFARRR